MIVIDTSVLVALGDTHHQDVVALYRRDRARWVIPWAILPEADYLIASRAGARANAVLLTEALIVWKSAVAGFSRPQT